MLANAKASPANKRSFFMMSPSRFGRAAAWPLLAGQAHPRNRSEKPKKINNRVI
jgi:hypothetical protein